MGDRLDQAAESVVAAPERPQALGWGIVLGKLAIPQIKEPGGGGILGASWTDRFSYS
jgi:hypothetical protein